MSLTADQAEQFQRRGFVVAEGIFCPRDLELIKAALTAVIDRVTSPFSDGPFAIRLACIMENDGEEGRKLYNLSWTRRGRSERSCHVRIHDAGTFWCPAEHRSWVFTRTCASGGSPRAYRSRLAAAKAARRREVPLVPPAVWGVTQTLGNW